MTPCSFGGRSRGPAKYLGLVAVTAVILLLLASGAAVAAPNDSPSDAATGGPADAADRSLDPTPSHEEGPPGTNESADRHGVSVPAGYVREGGGVVHRDAVERPYFAVTTSASGPASVDEQTTLTLRVTAKRSVANATVTVPDYEVIEMDRHRWSLGTIAANETRTVEVNVTPAIRQHRGIFFRLAARADGVAVQREFVHTLSFGTGLAANATSGAVAVPERAVPDAPERDVEPQASGKTTVKGRFVYANKGSGFSPGRQLKVQLWEYDPNDDDDFIAEKTTDDNGRYSFTVDPDAGGDPDSPNHVYVKVWAYNPAVKVTDGSKSQWITSTGVNRMRAGGTIDHGTYASQKNQPYQAADWALDQYRFVRDNTGVPRAGTSSFTRSRVRVEWPESDWPSHNYRYNTNNGNVLEEEIQLPPRVNYSWGRATVFHEYAHALMLAMYGNDVNNLPSKGNYGNKSHALRSETDPGFALIEGWAEFMEAAVDDDPTMLGGSAPNIETNRWFNTTFNDSCCVRGDFGDWDGNSVESSYASIWFDIVDTGNANDEPMEYPYNLLFYEIRGHQTQSMNDFWDDWNQGNRSELARAFYRHGILKNDWADLDVVLNPDPNDKKSSAVDMPYPGRRQLMMIRGENDWFYVDLDRGEEVDVSVNTSAPGLLDLLAIGPGDAVVAGSRSSGVAYNSISFTASQSGRYYVKVKPASFSPRDSVPYELDWDWERSPRVDSYEENDDFGTAATIGRQSYHRFVTIVAGDPDFYALSVKDDEWVNVSAIFDDDDGDINIWLYGPNKNESPAIASSTSHDDDESFNVTVGSAGTYYLYVDTTGSSVHYDLDVDIRTSNDDYEPNDERINASPVPATGFDAVIFEGEVDWYVTDLVSGEELNASVESKPGDTSAFVAIYDSSGTKLDESFADGSAVATATADGPYYVKVFPRSDLASPTVEYRLDLATTLAPGTAGSGNNAFGNATPTNPGTYTGLELTEDDTADYYAVNLTRGEALEVDVTHDQPELLASEDILLFDPDRNLVNRTTCCLDVLNLSADLIAQQTGTYYVVVNGSEHPPFEYNLSITTRDDDELEENDEFAEAPVIGSGRYQLEMFADSTANGGAGERDIYGVNLTTGDTLNVSMRFDPKDAFADVRVDMAVEDRTALGLAVYWPNQTVLVENTTSPGNRASVSVNASRNGTYYVEVLTVDFSVAGRGENDATPYLLDVEGAGIDPSQVSIPPRRIVSVIDPVGSLSTIDRLGIGRLPPRTLPPVATDVYVGNATAGDRIAVTAIPAGDSEAPPDLAAFNSEGERVATSGNGSLRFTADLTGRYYVRATNPDEGAQVYSLSVQRGGPGNDRLEPSEGSEIPVRVEVGRYDGLRLVGSDVDNYVIDLQNGEVLSATVDTDGDVSVSITGPEGEVLASGTGSLEAAASLSGPHLVTVVGEGTTDSSAIDYALEIATRTPGNDGFEPNGGIDAATTWDPGETGTLEAVLAGGERDTYAVDLAAGETLSITVSADRAGEFDLGLYGPSGGLLDATTPATDVAPDAPGRRTLSVTAEEAGTYYVDLFGRFRLPAAYALRAEKTPPPANDHLEPNDGFETAAPLERELSTVEGLQLVPGERDLYRVNLSAGERMEAAALFAHADGDVQLRILGPDRVPIASARSATDDEALAVTARSSGRYYVEVFGRTNGSTAPYALRTGVAGPTEIDDDGFEDNDDIENATSLPTGRYVDLRIAPGESDFYAVEAAAGERFYVELAFAHADADIDLRVYNATGAVVNLSASGSDDELVILPEGASGRYVIEVFSAAGEPGRYNLTASPSLTFPVDPTRTYLHVVDDDAGRADPVRLARYGIGPGDSIRLSRLGSFEDGAAGQGLLAVFSTNETLLSGDRRHRVPGAIDAGTDVTTSRTFNGNETTDVPEDFLVADNAGEQTNVTVTVPEGARYLFVAGQDNFYEDNSDPDDDFRVRLSIDSPPTIEFPTATDSVDFDGNVSDGDTVVVSATVTDAETGVDTVIANASAFGAETVTLTREDGSDTYVGTFTVNASAGAGTGSYPVRIVATDTAGNTAEATTDPLRLSTCVAGAVSGSDDTIDLGEIQDAINWWAEGTEVPGAGGETISLSEIQDLINAWAEDTPVSCTT